LANISSHVASIRIGPPQMRIGDGPRLWGGKASFYLTAYDLSIRDAFESLEGLRARKTPWYRANGVSIQEHTT
jgi:hypothetical protein